MTFLLLVLVPVELGVLTLVYGVHAIVEDFRGKRKIWACFGILATLATVGSLIAWQNEVGHALAGL